MSHHPTDKLTGMGNECDSVGTFDPVYNLDPGHLRAPRTHYPATDFESERALVDDSGRAPLTVSRGLQGSTGFSPH